MKKMLALVLVGLCLASAVAWTAQPTTTIRRDGNICEVRMTGTTNAPDTTIIDMSDADWSNSIANSASLDFSFFGGHALGDSINVVMTPAFRKATTGWIVDQFAVGSTAFTAVVNGQTMAAATSHITTLCPYVRLVVSDGDPGSSNLSYDVYMYFTIRNR